MIFVTVGGQQPFDRLVDCVDAWAGSERLPKEAVFAQIGNTTHPPSHIDWAHSLSPPEYHACIEKATVIIAHAGMGTILTAIEMSRPILVMPRIASQGEHRNDHQLATARQLAEIINLTVAWDEIALRDWLGRLETIQPCSSAGDGLDQITTFVKSFIQS